jgi:tetratricopeptide (TPR) repeat protein
MKWHWEASHYKLATGTLVLDRVLGYREPGRDVPDDFGVPLTGENIEGELNKLLADSRLYDRQYPEYVAEIRDRAEQVLEGRTGVMCTPSYQALQTAAAALDSGDRAGAMMQIDRAALLQAEEMAEFKRRGLPYREAGLATMIQKARETGIIERLLETWEAYQERGIKRLTNGDRAGAITDFGEAIRRGPPNAALHYLRGTARAQMGNHTGAIEDFDVILKLDPGNVTVPILREQSLAVLKAAAK